MYNWLLDKVVHKCHKVGVEDTKRVVSVVTGIFNELPEETEQATRELADTLEDDEDIDMIEFFKFFSDKELLKRKFGSEIYGLFQQRSKVGSSTTAFQTRSLSSGLSSLPHPSKVDYDSLQLNQSHAIMFKPSKMSSYTSSSVSTRETTTPSPSSGSTVRSALKLRWPSPKSGVTSLTTSLSSSTTPSSLVQSARRHKPESRRMSSGATKVSLTIPSESSITFSEGSSGTSSTKDIKDLRSALRRSSIHSILSPKKRKYRPSSVTFASPVISLSTSSEIMPSASARESAGVADGHGVGVVKEGDRSTTEHHRHRYHRHHKKTHLTGDGKDEWEEEEGEESLVEAPPPTPVDIPELVEMTDISEPVEIAEPVKTYAMSILEKDPGELDEGEQLLREMLTKPYFPESFKAGEDKPATVNNVFEGLCKLDELFSAVSPSFPLSLL